MRAATDRPSTAGRAVRRARRVRRRGVPIIAALAVSTGAVVAGPAAPALAADPTTIDGEFEGTGVIGPRETVALDVTGRGGVPANGVGAVALNVTVTNPTAPTYLTVFPAGSTRPTASNLNALAGQTVPNMVISKVGDDGQVSLYNRDGDVDVIVDVLGWFPDASGFTPISPARVLDTRRGEPTVDGEQAGGGALGRASSRSLPIGGRAGVPDTADAVVVNVAVTAPTAPSYLSLWPAGEARPTAANVNYAPGQTVSNMAMARLGDGGAVSLYNHDGRADVVVDVLGWFPGSDTFTGLTPARLMDTRPGESTIDGRYAGEGMLNVDDTDPLDVVGRGGVPSSGVGAVALNVAVTQPTANSYVTVWPAGIARPTASNLNVRPGQTVSNMVLVEPGDAGLVSLYNLAGTAHAVVDVLGWLPSSGGYEGLTPARLMDTRSANVPPPPPPGDPGDPSLDPFVCRTYEHAVVGSIGDPALNEISGMARGRRDRSVLWVHEDSGAKPDVHALTLTGQSRQTFRLSGVTARDWEDMGVGPGPQPGVHYLYMGDIGDNGKSRPDITIYRVPEPAVTGAGGITDLGGAQGLVARYPDGAHNAEAMAVGADGTIYVITKEKTTGVYAMPYPQSTTGVNVMTKIDAGTLAPMIDRSGADIRPDGRALIVRGYRGARTWPIVPGEPMAATLAREPCESNTLREEYWGEAVAFLGNDGSYMSVGENTNGPLRHYTL